jgi:ribosomal protein S18 acetylase RimI-like enzyme
MPAHEAVAIARGKTAMAVNGIPIFLIVRRNVVAQSLYKSLGFSVEGLRRKAWQLRDEYFDVYQMARVE